MLFFFDFATTYSIMIIVSEPRKLRIKAEVTYEGCGLERRTCFHERSYSGPRMKYFTSYINSHSFQQVGYVGGSSWEKEDVLRLFLPLTNVLLTVISVCTVFKFFF